MPVGRFEALITVPSGATLTATNSGGGPTVVTIPAGNYFLDDLLGEIEDQLDATRTPATWAVSISEEGLITINHGGSFTLTWSNTDLRDLLGFTGNHGPAAGPFAGTKQARGVWYPASPLFIRDGDPRMAPIGSDARSTVAPTGADPVTLVGTYFRYHNNVMWSHIPVERIREEEAVLDNASWRTFWDDTQLARGHAWFKPGANVRIYDHTDQVLGSDMNSGAGPTGGWHIVDATRIHPKRVDEGGWTGMWSLELPILIAKDA